MANIKGKVSKVEFDSNEICFQNADYDESWEIEDVTDSCTSGDGEESEGIIAERVVELSGNFKPSGSRVKGKDMTFTLNGVEYKIMDMNFEESPVEIDVGESGTDGTQTEIGFINRKSSINMLMKKGVAPPSRNLSEAATQLFATGISVAGNFRVESIKKGIQVKEAVKYDFNGTWQGGVTKLSMGLNVGDSGSLKIIYEEGTVSNQEDVGTGILVSITISANWKGFVKVTYRFKFNGDVTENEHSDT